MSDPIDIDPNEIVVLSERIGLDALRRLLAANPGTRERMRELAMRLIGSGEAI